MFCPTTSSGIGVGQAIAVCGLPFPDRVQAQTTENDRLPHSEEYTNEHAHARAEAMLLRDQRAAEAGSPSLRDWRKIHVSWVSLRDSLGTTER